MLTEAFWDEASRTATKRYYRIETETAAVTRWASSQQAYSEDEYRALLTGCGFGDIGIYPALASESATADFCAIVAVKM